MPEENLLKRIKELEREVAELKHRRIHQQDITSDAVKERHVGEGVRFIRAGLAANKPTTPEKDGAVYFETDTNKLFIGDTSAWLEEEFT